MRHLDLFSGIGGFAIATEMVWDDVEHVFCDNEPFAQAVLTKHWPNAPIYGDIRTLTANAERERQSQQKRGQQESGQRACDLLTGGFPCQPFSAAGRRLGTQDDRHLWPEMLRVIREFRPSWIIAENVGGLVTWSEGLVLEQIHLDLEAEGYEVQAFIIPAVALNAPHKRDRVWIVAYPKGERTRRKSPAIRGAQRRQDDERFSGFKQPNIHAADPANTERGSRQFSGEQKTVRAARNDQLAGRDRWHENWTEVATRLCRVDDGLSRRLDRNSRLKGLGNAIVPQIAAEIMMNINLITL